MNIISVIKIYFYIKNSSMDFKIGVDMCLKPLCPRNQIAKNVQQFEYAVKDTEQFYK